MAVPGQRFVAGDYWRSKHDDDIEEKRKLLISLENRRKELHPTGSPTPIRFVYVAWGIIRLGDRFLLHHREDRSRSEVKNYVFPGGRFRPLDLPAEKWDAATLRHLHKSASRLAMGALEQTLHRELGEELKLSSEDWSATPSVVLEPYRKIEGSKNAHELTEYLIALYAISLTPEGEARLLDQIDADQETLVWFGIEDLVDPSGRSNRKGAFIEALSAHFGGKEELKYFLQDVRSSSTTEYMFNSKESAVELPALPGTPVLIGGTGKEKNVR